MGMGSWFAYAQTMRPRLRAGEISGSGSHEQIKNRSFAKAEKTPPFDSARLDALLDEAGIDALVVSSKHNIQYLFGGYRFFFFDHFDAIGVSRYLPILIYVKGRPDQSTYIGQGMEALEKRARQILEPRLSSRRHDP